MDLTLNDDQKQLLDWANSVLVKEFSLERFNGLDGTLDEPGLHALAELGWFGISAAEAAGGAGQSVIEETVLMLEAGKFLPSPTILAQTLAVHEAALDERGEDVASLMSLKRRAALGIRMGNDGRKLALLDAQEAVLAIIYSPDGLEFLKISDLEPLKVNADCIDDSLQLRLFQSAEGAASRADQDSALFKRAGLLLSSLMTGAGDAALAMAIDYAKTREQFGAPIGSFQAIKHKCANMSLALTAARAQIYFAAAALNEGLADAEYRILAALSLAEKAASRSANDNIQIHGGIGFTSECGAQRFAKRVSVLRMFADADKRICEKLLDGPPQL